MSDLVERLRETLAGVATPVMRGDNLSILLASEFDNPDQPEGEHGWPEDAIKGADEVLDAIHAHYVNALAEQARLNGMGSEREARLMAVLRPFATYMQPGNDCDDKGAPLPDGHGVGWVYLTMGDFRRAAAAIRELTAKDGEEGK